MAQPAFSLMSKSHITIPLREKTKHVQYELECGSLTLEYSNDILKNMCDTLLPYKQLYVFRYIPLKNLFTSRENLHRKIELHAPLYLIKKLFVNNTNKKKEENSEIFEIGASIKDMDNTKKLDMKQILKNPREEQKKFKISDFNSDDDCENENIPEDEDIDKYNSRMNI